MDIRRGQIWRHDGSARPARCWQFDQSVGCIALCQGGDLLAALRGGVYALRLRNDGGHHAVRVVAARHGHGLRFNDGRCDRQGRFRVGSMDDRSGSAAAIGSLARLSSAGEAEEPWQPPLRGDLRVPNGLAFSPDGWRIYHSDSHVSQAKVWVCDYDAQIGQAGPPRHFIERLPLGRPDGAAVDSNGGYWTCANDGWAVLRYTPAGQLDRRLNLPMAKPTMCAFGGSDMDTLPITSMLPTRSAADIKLSEWDGALLALRPGISGLAETPWRPT